MLFYAIPRQDTKPIARRLMEHFGSLGSVFCAPPEELASVDGVGEHAATLIAMMLPIMRRACLAASRKDLSLADTERLGRYFCALLFGEQKEMLYEVCMDAKGKLLRCYPVSEGRVDSVGLDVRSIVENALRCHASTAALGHNHPSGIALPSQDDNEATLMAYNALRTIGVELTDHIIVADRDFVSLRDNGLLPPK